jgi:hypothetical protein
MVWQIGTNFGLINRTYPGDAAFDWGRKKSQWERFANQVNLLNFHAPRNVQYKVLFIGRHGDGFHNDAESYFGTPAWNVSTWLIAIFPAKPRCKFSDLSKLTYPSASMPS